LQQIAQRLKQTIRSNDTVSRQGGDEFIVLLPNIDNIEQVGLFASRLLRVVSEPYWIAEHRYDLSVSIGISIFPDDSTDMEAMYRHADAAMYRAKQEGRNRFQFFSTEIEETLRAKHQLERQMRQALNQGAFEVFYQAKVDASCMQITGAEALVRWRTPDGKLVSPAEFIPLAEETGLIIPLGNSVMRQACMDMKSCHDAGIKARIAINISAVQFGEASFVSTVQSIMAETGIDPSYVELEITEGMLAKNIEQAAATISRLKNLGVKFALDDFGTGYSSLAYLKHFPIDVIKIDQSFVRDMLTDPSDAAIVFAIISMANGLKLSLVAEGVETCEHAAKLLEHGCTIMQGYLYSRPIPFTQFKELLERGLSLPHE
jgi:predicted signal transduction protein with EAL and GGDEF domain